MQKFRLYRKWVRGQASGLNEKEGFEGDAFQDV